MASRLSLVLGGVRSGKSAFAEGLARSLDVPTLYVATGRATDAEMQERIRRHREARPAHWTTLEAHLELAGPVKTALAADPPPGAVLVDSLDVWVSNLLLEHEGRALQEAESLVLSSVDALLEVCQGTEAACFLVSSEVGLTLVPAYPLGRQFQDALGLVNQRVAAAAERVYLVVAGIPVALKGPPGG